MEEAQNSVKLEYNTQRTPLSMPEYGRNVMKMVESLKLIEDRGKRTEQANAVIRVMELLNPSVRLDENWTQRLWDHLYIMSGFNLDVDSPYPMPLPEHLNTNPMSIPIIKKPIKATHYGRNIESIIDLIAKEPEGERKTAMLRQLAIYMRQQYLIWNKDSVADETIFKDIEMLSNYTIVIPEGLSLNKLSYNGNYSRPSLNFSYDNNRRGGGNHNKRNFIRKNTNKR